MSCRREPSQGENACPCGGSGRHRRRAPLALVIVLLASCQSCCGLFVFDSKAQVQEWVAEEIPAASPVSALRRFAVRHGFEFREDPRWHSAYTQRHMDTCVLYDTWLDVTVALSPDNQRIQFVEVRRDEYWP